MSEDEVDGERVVRLSIPEMDCPSCAEKVEVSLKRVDGVKEYSVNPTTGTAKVELDSDRDTQELVDAVEGAGYSVDGFDGTNHTGRNIWRSSRAIKTWVSGGFLAAGLITEFTSVVGDYTLYGDSLLLPDVFFLLAIAFGGQEILRNGYYSARNLSLDMDFLMSVAILGAVTASVVGGVRLYLEAASLAFLFSVAELLEMYSMDRARKSLRELMELSPDNATVKRGETTETVGIDSVEVGDVVVVEPGEKIPLDGSVVEGESAVNEAPITGESVPVDKEEGDDVYAGTINETGYIEVRVSSTSEHSTISRIIELVEEAQAGKTEREQFVERFSGIYTPVMVGFAIVIAGVPPVLGEPWLPWFVNGITLLVLACPCAFVISTPVSIVSGITNAARNGVLVKGGNHLENMGSVGVVAFDKTGTLTQGELSVTDVIPLNGYSREEVLRCAIGVESRSEHPIANAITSHTTMDLERDVSDFEYITGMGVRASLDGVPHVAGKPDLFTELGFDLEHVHALPGNERLEGDFRELCRREGCLNIVEDTVPELQREGKTVVLVGTEDEIEGIIAVRDDARPGSKRVVNELREMGLHTVMLTGDNEYTARVIAEELGLDEYRAELLPEEKVEEVKALEEEYGGVAMVGDGVNDAPALATSTVGIAMGAAGTDTALETADIALMKDDLSKLPYTYRLSRKAGAVIRENVWTSLGAKLMLAAGVPLGFVGVATAVLVGDVGMTLGVTGNALRLAHIETD